MHVGGMSLTLWAFLWFGVTTYSTGNTVLSFVRKERQENVRMRQENSWTRDKGDKRQGFRTGDAREGEGYRQAKL